VSACPKCGLLGGRHVTHVCLPTTTPPGWNPPPAWECCPHCQGTGIVQADDRRYSDLLAAAGGTGGAAKETTR
jgi:hypothetical protein